MAVKKTLRFDDVTADALARLAAESGKSQAQAAADAIMAATERRQDDGKGDGTFDGSAPSKVVDLLAEQLAAKDAQLAEKSAEIKELHRLLDQSQQLQLIAHNNRLPGAGESKPKKGRKKGKKH